ncbi:MAG: outer membrane protein assembly factor BamB family protein [Planctomycetota bacterium]|jgi:outer membrane protein assembly factor BamB
MKWPAGASATSVAVILLVSVTAPAEDWPQWRGPTRDGKSPETGLLKRWPGGGPRQLWKVTGLGPGYSSPSVAGGRIYITGHSGGQLVMKALDLQGNEQWSVKHGPAWTKNYPASRGSPTVDGRNIYLLSGHGLLNCYATTDGRKLWSVDITKQFGGRPAHWGYAESPLVLGRGVLVTPGGSNCVVALDKGTGRTFWTSRGLDDGPQYSSLISFRFGRQDFLATMTQRSLVCLNAASGQFQWRNDRAAGSTAVIPTPVYSDGYVFGASGYGNGGACVKVSLAGNRLKGVQAWETDDMVCHLGGFVVVDGYIYGNHSGGWNCLELKTGRKCWNGRGVGKGSVIYADGMLYTFSENRGRMGLVEATPDGFRPAGEFSVAGSGKSWAHPVISGGRLYLRYEDNLYAFDIME